MFLVTFLLLEVCFRFAVVYTLLRKKVPSVVGVYLFIYYCRGCVCFGREFRKIKRNMFCLSLIVLRGLLTGQACEAAGNADSSVISTNRFRWVGFLGYNMRRVILGIWRPCTVALAITFHPEFRISNFEFIISSNLRYVKKKSSCRRF